MTKPIWNKIKEEFRMASTPQGAKVDEGSSSIQNAIIRIGFQLCLDHDHETNVVLSPVGISYILALLYLGSRGDTRQQLAGIFDGMSRELLLKELVALSYELGQRSRLTDYEASYIERHQATLEKLLAKGMKPRQAEYEVIQRIGFMAIKSRKDLEFTLSMANSIWVQHSYRCNPAYLERVENMPDVQLGMLDFSGKPEEACANMNAWVRKNTHGFLDTLISPFLLSPLTRVILANIIYFKAQWQDKFNPPRPEPFYLLDGSIVQAQMINKTTHYRYVENKDYQAVLLPYKHRPVSMLIVLPRKHGKQALTDLERTLGQCQYNLFLPETSTREIQITMPEFEFGLKKDLKAVISRQLSLNVFETGDFSGISEEKDFGIDNILHHARIRVDQFGTEAAAVSLLVAAGSAPPQKTVELTMDRPFLFLLLDEPTKTALFVGRIVNPEGTMDS